MPVLLVDWVGAICSGSRVYETAEEVKRIFCSAGFVRSLSDDGKKGIMAYL